MNSTETYDHFAIEFPPVHPEDHTWRNVHDGHTSNINTLSEMITEYIEGSSAVVVIHSLPGIGAKLALSEVAGFVTPHILSAEIQIADPEFSSFVAIARSGVATGWKVEK